MRNPYEAPNEWEAGGEPDEREPEPAPECRNPDCRSHEGPFNYFGGWPWCAETCYREITRLAMDQMLRGQEQASKQDIERDDVVLFRDVRRG